MSRHSKRRGENIVKEKNVAITNSIPLFKSKRFVILELLLAMKGQEAHYALSVKYGKEGKPVPQYDWADPTDYGVGV